MIKNYKDFRTELAKYADDAYREFCMKGIPCERPFIGVKIPQIREIVKDISPAYLREFLTVAPVAIEEVLARGMVICGLPYEEMLEYFDSQVGYIDNWCSCDTFCSGLRKMVDRCREGFFEAKVEKLLGADDEYAVRVGLVMLKTSYVEPDYLNLIFDRVERLADREEHYIKMAIAWLLAECFVEYPSATTGYLLVSHLPKWTFNKTIAKICDSYRVDKETKEMVKKMRR